MKKRVVIIDYGSGNLFSIAQSLTKCGSDIIITDDQKVIKNASHLVIPGVGSFGECVNKLKHEELICPLKEAINRGTWLLAICVGMQILFDKGEEFDACEGLGVIPGKVVALCKTNSNGTLNKIPHMGWSPLNGFSTTAWHGTILDSIPAGSACYFAHSFMAVPASDKFRLADTNLGDMNICAAVKSENVYGCQFHPEKSGETGLKIMKNFIAL
jgi:imidazole glycerol-phosphate synthase subunit HisH